MKNLFTLLISFLSLTIIGQSVEGQWRTVDDDTGQPKSIVEIYKKDGVLFGKIITLINPSEENPICDLCEGDRKDKEVIGMEIIRDMKQDGNEWESGTIVDPATGKVYDCGLWIDENDSSKLQVRGYILFFYRTQTWERVN